MPQSTEEREVLSILKAHGATLERTKKHKVWRFPDGRSWAFGSSPSDVRAWKNNLHELRNFLGLNDPERGKPGARRPKKAKKQRQKFEVPLESTIEKPRITMADELLQLREQLPTARIDLAAQPLSEAGISVKLPEPVVVEGLRYSPPLAPSVVPTTRFVWWNPWTWF